MKSTKIRAGLYRVTTDNGIYTIEQRNLNGEWIWRLSDDGKYIDNWIDDFATKKDALAFIS